MERANIGTMATPVIKGFLVVHQKTIMRLFKVNITTKVTFKMTQNMVMENKYFLTVVNWRENLRIMCQADRYRSSTNIKKVSIMEWSSMELSMVMVNIKIVNIFIGVSFVMV